MTNFSLILRECEKNRENKRKKKSKRKKSVFEDTSNQPLSLLPIPIPILFMICLFTTSQSRSLDLYYNKFIHSLIDWLIHQFSSVLFVYSSFIIQQCEKISISSCSSCWKFWGLLFMEIQSKNSPIKLQEKERERDRERYNKKYNWNNVNKNDKISHTELTGRKWKTQ